MPRRLWIVVLLLCSAFSSQAIEAVLSHTLFYQNGQPVLESYWQIDPRSLYYTRNADSTISSRYQTFITLRTDTGIIHQERYLSNTPAVSEVQAVALNITDIYRHAIPAGKKVHLEIVLAEIDRPEKSVTLTDTITGESLVTNVPTLSQLQLLDTFYAERSKSIFSKGGRMQVPLCASFLEDTRHNLHYYAELYQIDALPKEKYPLVRRVFVSKKAGDAPIYYLLKTDSVSTQDQAFSVVGSLPISALPSGNFYVNLTITDNAGKSLAATNRFFQRSNANPTEAVAPTTNDSAKKERSTTFIDLGNSFVARYKAPQIRAILKMLLPVADPAEMAGIQTLLQTPDDVYSRYFITNFFKRRNAANPEAAWKAYSDKVRDVNKQFNAGNKPGYETDRGIILLKYGKPDERVPVINETGSRPYEVWVYNILGGRTNKQGVFLFYQPSDFIGDFRLLHSTVPDETRNPAWRQMLYINGTAGVSNSRAEQYFQTR